MAWLNSSVASTGASPENRRPRAGPRAEAARQLARKTMSPRPEAHSTAASGDPRRVPASAAGAASWAGAAGRRPTRGPPGGGCGGGHCACVHADQIAGDGVQRVGRLETSQHARGRGDSRSTQPRWLNQSASVLRDRFDVGIKCSAAQKRTQGPHQAFHLNI